MRFSPLWLLWLLTSALACGSPPITSAPMTTSPEGAPPSSTPAPATAAPPPTATKALVVDGELRPSSEVVFEVRPLSGPGTMGPTVLSAKSEPALEEVRAHLAAHPEIARVRIEYGVNPTRMSSSPDATWPARLSLQVARWLVDRGIDCKRLDAIGWLESTLDPGSERVRFFVGPSGAEHRAARRESHADVCGAKD